jgi:cytochrome c2
MDDLGRTPDRLTRLLRALLGATAILGVACGRTGGAAPPALETGVGAVEQLGGNPQRGKAASERYGCGACHVIPGVDRGSGMGGPPLTGFANRPVIAGDVRNSPDTLLRWLQNPQAVKPSATMPPLGISETDARDIAAYLYTLE